MNEIKVRKLMQIGTEDVQIMTWSQVITNPTALATLLITLDNLKEGEMLEIRKTINNGY